MKRVIKGKLYNGNSNWTEKLVELGACSKAVEWSKQYKTFEEAWAACDNISWLLWLVGRKVERKTIAKIACKFARLVLKYTNDKRVLTCIETIEAWVEGKATISEVKIAAYFAANAARAAGRDGFDTVNAANAAANAAHAADADDAGNTAFYAGHAAYFAANAARDTGDAMIKACIKIIKEEIKIKL